MTGTRFLVVDATALGPEPSGARRRLAELLPRLVDRLTGDVFEVHWAADGGGPGDALEAVDGLVHVDVPDVSWRGGARRWRRRARALRRRRKEAAFTHLLVDHGPVLRLPGVRTVVTVHDLRFLHGWTSRARAFYGRHLYGRLLRRADALVAVSPSVAAEARRVYGVDAGRLWVAPNAPAAPFRPPVDGAPRDGALVVARDEPRKARGAAAAAARAAGMSLAVVDGSSSDDEALARRYAAARWLLAPSLEEGFDLPVVEALACGTPVVASDIPAHRDLVAWGAEGLVLAGRPTRRDGRWTWPEAADRLREDPPAAVGPPRVDWSASADVVARAIRDDVRGADDSPGCGA